MTTQPPKNPNLYVSPEGYSVEIVGWMTGLIYREGSREMLIDSEMLVLPFLLCVYTHSISHWKPSYDAVPVTPEERKRIVENIRILFRSHGYEIDTFP